MKERPILFSAPMVRAILDGRKLQTRRVIAHQPSDGWAFDAPPQFGRITSPHPKKGRFGAFIRHGVGTDFPRFDLIPCPYGQPGDRLWVRETWAQPAALDPGPTVYRADYPDCVPADFENIPPADAIRWKPSIHMPRSASRITLEITGVRVERLQDISETDAIAEGIDKTAAGFWSTYGQREVDGTFSPRSSFQSLWESINGLVSWEANPYVWVIEFKRTTDTGELS